MDKKKGGKKRSFNERRVKLTIITIIINKITTTAAK